MPRILSRADNAANWTSANPVLGQGEIGVEVDTFKLKVGDGTLAWNALSYITGTGGGDGIAQLTGPKLIGRITSTLGDYEELDGDDAAAAFDFATTTDVADVTDALSAHVGVDGTETGDDIATVHGFYPQTVLRGNFVSQRIQPYVGADVTAVPAGFAPTGKIEFLPIGVGANKGWWYRDDAHVYERVGPADVFTPVSRMSAVGRSTTWTNMPSALTEFLGDETCRVPCNVYEDDFTTKRYTQARIGINNVGTIGNTGSKLALYYSDGSGLVAAGATAVEVAITSTGAKLSAWVDLAAGVFTREATALRTVFAIQGSGGDGVIDPVVSGVFVDLR